MEIRVKLGRNVRRLINAKGLSLREFARGYGFHMSLIARVVAGEANITILQLDKLARALNVRPEKLIS
jgi:transcriptional regulator with XRE-family HTH domain